MSIKYNDKTNNREILLAGISPVDQILNGTSKNAIANKAVYNALKEKIDKTVSDLVNYYSKVDVYNKAEVRALISTISTMDIQVVNALPTEDISTTTIYFLKPAGATTYDEYVYINNAWVKIGTTDLDLSQYVTNDALTLRLADYYTKAEIDTLLTQYAQKDNVYDKDAVDALLDNKQNSLTFDSTPTAGSSNPVTSDGIKDAIDDTAADIYEVIGKNGAKNLLPNTATSKTQNGITFTVNNDGSVTVNGTATANTVLYIYDGLSVPNGSYKISANASLSMDLQVVIDSGSYGGTRKATVVSDSEVSFNVNNETLFTYVWVRNGTTINNVTIYPMLRFAFDTDSTYQPYAMTNKELTSLLTTNNAFIVPVVLGNTFSMMETPYRCNHVKLETLGVLGNAAVYISSVTLNVYNQTFIYTETQSLVNLLAADSHYTGLTKEVLVAEGGLHAYLSIVD